MTRLADLGTVFAYVLARHRRRLILGALSAGLTVLCGVALLGLSGWFITATALAGLSAATAILFDVFAPAAGIRLLAIGRTAARYGERLVTHDVTLRALADLRQMLFLGWAAPSAARRLLDRPARLLFRLTADIDALDSLYLRILVPAAAALTAILALGLALMLVHPLLAIGITLVLLLVGLAIPALAARVARGAARRRASALEALRARTVDLLAGQTDLIMTGRLDAQRQAVMQADRYGAAADLALNRIDTSVGFGFGVFTSLLLASVLLALAGLAAAGTVSPPVAALVLLASFAAVEPFAALRRGALELGRLSVAAARLAPRLRGQQDGEARCAPAAGEALRLKDIQILRDDGSRGLRDISLCLHIGETLALVGPSGSGKSTLLALIAGEIEPSAGAMENLPATLITQRSELFADTLAGNLALADPAADEARLMTALRQAGLADFVDELPGRLATRLGEGGLGLSGGQARRLALARLFLRDTPLWLVDEPTEGVDGETARDVMACLSLAAAGRSLVIATHIRREAACADVIAELQNGRLARLSRRGEAAFERALDRLRPD